MKGWKVNAWCACEPVLCPRVAQLRNLPTTQDLPTLPPRACRVARLALRTPPHHAALTLALSVPRGTPRPECLHPAVTLPPPARPARAADREHSGRSD